MSSDVKNKNEQAIEVWGRNIYIFIYINIKKIHNLKTRGTKLLLPVFLLFEVEKKLKLEFY